MKREVTKTRFEVYTTWPLFDWAECWICGEEWRREWGYQVLVRRGGNRPGTGVCGTCADSKEQASELCYDKIKNMRPPNRSDEINFKPYPAAPQPPPNVLIKEGSQTRKEVQPRK